MSRQNNRFINLLFEENPISPRKIHASREVEMKKIDSYVEENSFQPRNRLRHMRVLRANDAIAIHAGGPGFSQQLRKMVVDGSHLTELIPRRELVTQNYRRSVERDRMYSPESPSRHEKNSNVGWLQGNLSSSPKQD
jgi:hypothetical protein